MLAEAAGDLRDEVIEQVEINVKYDGYLDKEREMAEKLTTLGRRSFRPRHRLRSPDISIYGGPSKARQGPTYHSRSSLSDQRSFTRRPERSNGLLGSLISPCYNHIVRWPTNSA